MTQSKELTEFYRAYLRWVETGESQYEFKNGYGLCRNLQIFAQSSITEQLVRHRVFAELTQHFFEAGLSALTPFNSELNQVPYGDEDDKTRNPDRMAWVREHAMVENENE